MSYSFTETLLRAHLVDPKAQCLADRGRGALAWTPVHAALYGVIESFNPDGVFGGLDGEGDGIERSDFLLSEQCAPKV